MSDITMQIAGKWPNLGRMASALEFVVAQATSATSREFAEYARDYGASASIFEGHGKHPGQTLRSIDIYRYKKRDKPSYVIRPGVGITGMLNYLYGEARGRAKSRSGNPFEYAKKRDVIMEAFQNWKGDLETTMQAELDKYLARAAGGSGL
jgi:hypothetical protein